MSFSVSVVADSLTSRNDFYLSYCEDTGEQDARYCQKWTTKDCCRYTFFWFYCSQLIHSPIIQVCSCYLISLFLDTGLLYHFHFAVRWLHWWWHLVDTDLYTSPWTDTFHIVSWYIQKFYFCDKCCHTLCLLTRINIEGHYVLYLTSQIEFMPTCFYSLLFYLCMWIYLIFAIYICGSILFLFMLILLTHLESA